MKKVENFARLNLLSFQEQLQNWRDLGVHRTSWVKKYAVAFLKQTIITRWSRVFKTNLVAGACLNVKVSIKGKPESSSLSLSSNPNFNCPWQLHNSIFRYPINKICIEQCLLVETFCADMYQTKNKNKGWCSKNKMVFTDLEVCRKSSIYA